VQYEFISHHGIKGQKWGRRLYQNDDGSLTPLGRLRYGKNGLNRSNSQTVKQTVKRAPTIQNESGEKQNYSAKSRLKNIDEMTDAELSSYINRVQLEQRYNALTTPSGQQKVSKGRAFAKYTFDKVLVPVATDMGKKVLTYYSGKAINKVFDAPIYSSNQDNQNNQNNQNDQNNQNNQNKQNNQKKKS